MRVGRPTLTVGGTIHGAGILEWIKREKKKTTKSYAFISPDFLVCEMWASGLIFHYPGTSCSYHHVFPNCELKLGAKLNLPSLRCYVTAMRNITNASWLVAVCSLMRETSPKRTVTILSSTEILFHPSPGSVSDFLHVLIGTSQMSHLLSAHIFYSILGRLLSLIW